MLLAKLKAHQGKDLQTARTDQPSHAQVERFHDPALDRFHTGDRCTLTKAIKPGVSTTSFSKACQASDSARVGARVGGGRAGTENRCSLQMFAFEAGKRE